MSSTWIASTHEVTIREGEGVVRNGSKERDFDGTFTHSKHTEEALGIKVEQRNDPKKS